MAAGPLGGARRARRAARRRGRALTGAPADREPSAAVAAALETRGARVENVAGRFRLRETVDVLAGAACVVSVNTGVMHLAAAAGVPTVALNGPTSSRRWGPLGPHVTNVDSELPGCGFLNLGFEYDGAARGLHGGRRRSSASPPPSRPRSRSRPVPDSAAVEAAVLALAASLGAGGKLLTFGNGGSAADAQHVAAELVGRFEIERPGLPAIALTTDSSALTAIANDYGYERVFARQVEALGRPATSRSASAPAGRRRTCWPASPRRAPAAW